MRVLALSRPEVSASSYKQRAKRERGERRKKNTAKIVWMSCPSDQKAVREVVSCGCACFTSYVLAAAPSGVHAGEATYPIMRQMATEELPKLSI